MTTHPCDIYGELRSLYDRCNTTFFGDTLPPCMILLRVKRNAAGYFQPACWSRHGLAGAGSTEAKRHDAIALNTTIFNARTEAEILSTLVHEMTHLWQEHYGDNVPTKNYHNREWARKMASLGLMPSVTGAPGGKQTGVHISHYILDHGWFASLYAELADPGQPLFTWQETPKLNTAKDQPKKYKYVCAYCEQKAWAHEGARLSCADCNEPMITLATQLPLPIIAVNMTTGEIQEAAHAPH